MFTKYEVCTPLIKYQSYKGKFLKNRQVKEYAKAFSRFVPNHSGAIAPLMPYFEFCRI